MKHIKTNIYLKEPIGESIIELQKLVNIWEMIIYRASTRKIKTEILIKEEIFKRLFGNKIKKGFLTLPEGLKYFINAIEVTEI
jgi:hypothetical protein